MRRSSKLSASSRTQSIQSPFSSGYINSSRVTAADYLRVDRGPRVYGYLVFVCLEFLVEVLNLAGGILVVKLALPLHERRTCREFDMEMMSSWYLPTYRIILTYERCLQIDSPRAWVRVYRCIARDCFRLFCDFRLLGATVRSKHQQQNQPEPDCGAATHSNSTHFNLLHSISTVGSA